MGKNISVITIEEFLSSNCNKKCNLFNKQKNNSA